jgi:hypothetical protein
MTTPSGAASILAAADFPEAMPPKTPITVVARRASAPPAVGSGSGLVGAAILELREKPRRSERVGDACMHGRSRLFLSLRVQVTASGRGFKWPRIRLPRTALVGYHHAPLSGADARLRGWVRAPDPRAIPSPQLTRLPARAPRRRSSWVDDPPQGFRMMKRSNRGAAKVSVVWAIGILMAFLVALVMFFLTSQQNTANAARAESAEKARKDLQAQVEEEKKHYQDLSTIVGYYDEAAAAPKTEIATITEGFKSLHTAFPEIDPSIKNFQKAMPVIVNAYNNQKKMVTERDTQLASLKAENEALNKSVRDIGEKNSNDQRELQRKLSDLEQARSDMQADLERQLAEARDNFKNADSKARQLQSTIDDNQRKFQQEAQGLRGKLAEQGRKLQPFTKQPPVPDGKVLGISTELNLGWINLGAKNRLPVGTRFRVVSSAHNESQVKAWAEVTQVEPDMAEVHFTDIKDPFDPPVVGDYVYNPLYDPNGERHAILLGRFSGAMNEKELKSMLSSMGVTVQKTLDRNTDFMIVGGEMYTDENGQPLAAPLQPSDLPVFKDAVAEGVQVVQLKDLRQYFRY